MPSEPSKPTFRLVAGALCLDFCNTVGGKRGNVAREKLHAYSDYVAWCEQAGLIDSKRAEQLLKRANHHQKLAEAALQRAIELREAVFRVFMDVTEERTVSPEELEKINTVLMSPLGEMKLIPSGKNGFTWRWEDAPEALDSSLGLLARSAADLLTDECKCCQVHQCQADNCGWLFLDVSKNHSRRWCDMRDCGNRAKVRRHRLKLKG